MKTCLAMVLCLLSTTALATSPGLRIVDLQRCGDLLADDRLHWCLRAEGLGPGQPTLWLGERRVPQKAAQRHGDRIEFSLDGASATSAALWLEQGDQRSNPVWLTRQRSHVRAAGADAVAKNMDGLDTYVDLVSLLIEERHDGRETAKRIARKYGAEVVGGIPPLNVYQLKLPVDDLLQRDAMVLRMGSETSVDAVIIEESAPEGDSEASGDSSASLEQAVEWAANRFMDAQYFYQRRMSASPIPLAAVRMGIIERDVDFDQPAFAGYLGPCTAGGCLYARDARRSGGHGEHVAGVVAASGEAGQSGFLSGLGKAGPRFEIIVERNSDAGITANIAASVNLVEDGVRVLNWSWGVHRIGARDVRDEEVDSLVRSGLAINGYEELLEEFFLWLQREHPDVVVVNSAGNGASWTSADDYRLPSSLLTDQLLVVGGHQRSDEAVPLEHPRHVTKRKSSNVDRRVDISAAACLKPHGGAEIHCGTSYATPLVSATVAVMLAINPQLSPAQVRMLLRRSALSMGPRQDFEAADADDLTAPILPSEREGQFDHPDLGRSARLDMRKALELAMQSRTRVR